MPSTAPSDALAPEPGVQGAACRRSRLSPAARFGLFFGLMLALKYALQYTGLSATGQVLALAGAASVFAWRYWGACGESRRGAVILLAVLWLAAAAKIALQP